MDTTNGNGQSFRDLVIVGLEQVNDELRELKRGQAIIERESREAISELRVIVARLETKIAMYASLGALVGSAVMTWIAETWRH
jgi:hypothetical protein